jgi:hypothetical protein
MPEESELNNQHENQVDDLAVLQQIISALQQVSKTFFDFSSATMIRPASLDMPRSTAGGLPTFSEDRTISPKEFIMEKHPQTDVERVACLAYYLSHFRDIPHFKTIDISKLNTEAAQRKFANAAKTVDNASTYGYLAPATKGQKQLSAVGELFVQALPDRDAAKDAIKQARPRRKAKANKKIPEVKKSL